MRGWRVVVAAGGLLLLGGLAADAVGLGGHPGIGWKQVAVSAAGAVLIAVGFRQWLLLSRAATLCGVLLACFVVAELGLRLVHHLRPSYIFEQRDAALRFRTRPYALNYDRRFNSGGFNDREFARRRPPGVYRIAALGDSFVFGVVPYEHNFLTLLEDRLAAEGRPVELLNLGIPGTGPEHHPRLIYEEMLALQPDAVIQFVYVGNDITEAPPPPPDRWPSYTLELLRFLLEILPRTELRVYHGRVYDDDSSTFEASAYLEIVGQNAVVFDPGWPELAARCEQLVTVIRRTAEICRNRGLELAVVLQPAELQVSSELQRQLAAAAREGSRPLDLELPNRVLRRALEEEGIAHYDLLPDFAAAPAARRLYKPNDSHWNIAGNALAAERLHAWLVAGDSGLELPPPRPAGRARGLNRRCG